MQLWLQEPRVPLCWQGSQVQLCLQGHRLPPWWRQVLWWELAAAAQGRQAQTAGHWVQGRWSELVMVMHLSTAQGRCEDLEASAA